MMRGTMWRQSTPAKLGEDTGDLVNKVAKALYADDAQWDGIPDEWQEDFRAKARLVLEVPEIAEAVRIWRNHGEARACLEVIADANCTLGCSAAARQCLAGQA